MNLYLEIVIFLGIIAITAPFILWFAHIFNSAIPVAPVFAATENTIINTATNALNDTLVLLILIVVGIGISLDIFSAIKAPNELVGVGSILMVFVVVAVWVMLDYFIGTSNILPIFGAQNSPIYQLFQSSYFISSICGGLIISAALHLSGNAQHPRGLNSDGIDEDAVQSRQFKSSFGAGHDVGTDEYGVERGYLE